MKIQAGGWYTRVISSNFESKERLITFAVLVMAGFITIAFTEIFKYPMKLPGRQGLAIFAAMVLSKFVSSERNAALIFALGGVGGYAVFAHGPFYESIILIAQGFLFDAAIAAIGLASSGVLVVALASGLVHAVKPILKWVGQFTISLPTDSLVNGLSYPIFSHLIFGSAGGAIGFLLFRSLKKK